MMIKRVGFYQYIKLVVMLSGVFVGLILVYRQQDIRERAKEPERCTSFFESLDVGAKYGVGDTVNGVFFNAVGSADGSDLVEVFDTANSSNVNSVVIDYSGKYLSFGAPSSDSNDGGVFEIIFPDSNVTVIDIGFNRGRRQYIVYRNGRWMAEEHLKKVAINESQVVQLGIIGGLKVETDNWGGWAVCLTPTGTTSIGTHLESTKLAGSSSIINGNVLTTYNALDNLRESFKKTLSDYRRIIGWGLVISCTGAIIVALATIMGYLKRAQRVKEITGAIKD